MTVPDPGRPTAPRRFPGLAALARAILVAVLAAALAAGCLPSGSRGGSAPAGSSDQPAPTVQPTPAGPTQRPTIVPPTPTPAPTFRVYVVARGDSLNTIARRFGTTARSIAFWNRATYPSLDPESAGYRPGLVKVGWTLFLIPNDIVDEQELPEPSTEPNGSEPSDPADESAAPG
jgi:hypothetical protein